MLISDTNRQARRLPYGRRGIIWYNLFLYSSISFIND